MSVAPNVAYYSRFFVVFESATPPELHPYDVEIHVNKLTGHAHHEWHF